MYAWSVSLIKLSILFFYRRIFGMTWLCWICIILTSFYLLVHHIVVPLFADPISFYWNRFLDAEGTMRVGEAEVHSSPFHSN